MIRLALPLIAMSLMGCAREADGEPYPIPPGPPTACGSHLLGSYVGKKRTDAIAAQVARISGAKAIRWIKPGMAVTMDYREDRLNVRLDDKDVILSVSCG
ncbi:I78 family peptidase inhibitor [Sphingomonas sp. LB-2]|uniref:I78 family peptidase inhibitor n=1 Tax=Sphingomonas caeni TaxID=2984949 RepID=UPI002231E6C1|nr:I78 family peptidase inhibitor [Sphingomonas caeni]MCW3849178.1 I78 family peptidase inhibitor [Sphingomonas caeni]